MHQKCLCRMAETCKFKANFRRGLILGFAFKFRAPSMIGAVPAPLNPHSTRGHKHKRQQTVTDIHVHVYTHDAHMREHTYCTYMCVHAHTYTHPNTSLHMLVCMQECAYRHVIIVWISRWIFYEWNLLIKKKTAEKSTKNPLRFGKGIGEKIGDRFGGGLGSPSARKYNEQNMVWRPSVRSEVLLHFVYIYIYIYP